MRFRGNEIVERFLGAVAALDDELAASLVSEDFVAVAAPGMMSPGQERVYEGRSGVKSLLAELAERCGGPPQLESRVTVHGGAVLAVGKFANVAAGVSRAGPFGSPLVDEPFAWLFGIQGNEIATAQLYGNLDDVLAAVDALFGFRGGRRRPKSS